MFQTTDVKNRLRLILSSGHVFVKINPPDISDPIEIYGQNILEMLFPACSYISMHEISIFILTHSIGTNWDWNKIQSPVIWPGPADRGPRRSPVGPLWEYPWTCKHRIQIFLSAHSGDNDWTWFKNQVPVLGSDRRTVDQMGHMQGHCGNCARLENIKSRPNKWLNSKDNHWTWSLWYWHHAHQIWSMGVNEFGCHFSAIIYNKMRSFQWCLTQKIILIHSGDIR